MVKIEFSDHTSEEINSRMREGLGNYESEHNIDVNYKSFFLILKDDNNKAIGILNAYTAFAEVYIEDLWVDSSHRHKGYGKKLLNTLEDKFEGKGFNNINFVTSQFQAPEFYKKCGYTLEFTRKNIHNPKLTKYGFIKYFKNENQTQGIIKR
jgi:ribosomal protein S18 acetylase RimI-like enzyme